MAGVNNRFKAIVIRHELSVSSYHVSKLMDVPLCRQRTHAEVTSLKCDCAFHCITSGQLEHCHGMMLFPLDILVSHCFCISGICRVFIIFSYFCSEQRLRYSMMRCYWVSTILRRHQDNMSVQCIPPYTPLLYSKTGVYRGIHYSYFCSKT